MLAIPNIKALGELIRKYRKKRNLSQDQLAHLCGTGRRFISELERGNKGSMEISLVFRVIQRLGLGIFAVVKNPEEENE